MSGFEETLALINPCFVYRIPPRTTTSGYKAEEWNLEKPDWTGRVRVKCVGELCFVQLEDIKTGDVFGVCKVNINSGGAETIEPVLDSSRYYVLRIDDEKTGRHAFIGMGFHDRDQSFEFKAAIHDHKRRLAQEKELRENPVQRPTLNLAMKSGETIHVDIKNFSSPGPQFSSKDLKEDDDDDDFGLLPPPPASKKVSSMSLKKQHHKPSPALLQTTNLLDPNPIIKPVDLLNTNSSSPSTNSPPPAQHNSPFYSPNQLNFPQNNTPNQPAHNQPMMPSMYNQPPSMLNNNQFSAQPNNDPFASLTNYGRK